MHEIKPIFRNDVLDSSAEHIDRSFEDEPTDEEIYIFKFRYNKDVGEDEKTNDDEIEIELSTVGSLLEHEQQILYSICGERYEEIQDNYRKKGNYKKMKPFEQWYKELKPMESMYQLGSTERGWFADKDLLARVYEKYIVAEQEFFEEHNIRVVYCDSALHCANAEREHSCTTTHIHSRKYILWQNPKTGQWEPNITKALETAGIERPDKSKRKSRYNNPRITLDNKLRELYRDCCIEAIKEAGLDDQVKVLPYDHAEPGDLRKKHKNKSQMFKQKTRELNARENKVENREISLNKQRNQLKVEQSMFQVEKAEFEQIKADIGRREEIVMEREQSLGEKEALVAKRETNAIERENSAQKRENAAKAMQIALKKRNDDFERDMKEKRELLDKDIQQKHEQADVMIRDGIANAWKYQYFRNMPKHIARSSEVVASISALSKKYKGMSLEERIALARAELGDVAVMVTADLEENKDVPD